MSERFAIERVPPRHSDRVLLLVLALMVGGGLAVLFSSSYYWAEQLYNDPFRLVRRQGIWVVLGITLGLLSSRVSLERLRATVPVMLIGAFGLMILTYVPGLGEEYLGARRWILLFGYSFQPSELVKLMLILYLAHILSKKQGVLDDTFNTVLPPLVVVSVFGTLIYLQNDFSTAIFVVAVCLLMFFVARVRLRFFLSLGIVAAPLTTILVLTSENRAWRILAFLDPEIDRFGAGYQVLAARSALENGGIWGRGVGQSLQKYGALPEPHSDFVFAILGEETGFIGILVVLGLFLLFAYRGFRLAFLSTDCFRSTLAFGLTASILFQALLNMAVVSGLVPATGVPLPLFSAGGSSALVTLLMCGLLINISRAEAANG